MKNWSNWGRPWERLKCAVGKNICWRTMASFYHLATRRVHFGQWLKNGCSIKATWLKNKKSQGRRKWFTSKISWKICWFFRHVALSAIIANVGHFVHLYLTSPQNRTEKARCAETNGGEGKKQNTSRHNTKCTGIWTVGWRTLSLYVTVTWYSFVYSFSVHLDSSIATVCLYVCSIHFVFVSLDVEPVYFRSHPWATRKASDVYG